MRNVIAIVICFVGITMVSGCASTKVAHAPDFTISKKTRFAIQFQVSVHDRSLAQSVSNRLETGLLRKGYEVVPYELIITKNYTDTDLSKTENSTKGTTAQYDAKYIPAAILINVTITQGSTWLFRVIDLKDKRLLYSKEYINSAKMTDKFIEDISMFCID